MSWRDPPLGSLTAAGPGTAYDEALSPEDQHSACTWTYRFDSASQRGLAYEVSATIEWTVAWAVAGAAGGGTSPGSAPRPPPPFRSSRELFSAVRARVGDALGLGVNVVNARTWRHHAHPRLLSALVGFAWTAASTGSVVVCVSPFTAYRRDPAAFAADTAELPARWRWVVLEAPGEVCRARMAGRGWGMDTDKLERWRAYERSQVGLGVPEGAIRVSSDLAASEYPAVAEALATALGWDQEGPRGRAGDQLRGAAGRSGRR